MSVLAAGAAVAEEQQTTAGVTLEEVVVTAEKRAENLQRTAVSVTAIDGDDLRKQGAFKVDDAIQAVPAVKVIGGPAGFLVRIRGEGINIPPNNGDPSVPVMLDGQYNSQVVTTFFGLYDLARVEVLRGPQGTLFGKNSTGGLVNFVSNTPADKEEGLVSLGFGNYSLFQTQGMYNTQVNDRLDLRIAGATTSHQGYLSNGDGGQDSKSARLSLLYKPNDNWSALWVAEYSTDGGTPPGSVIAYTRDDPSSTPAHGSSDPWYDPSPPGSWWNIRYARTWADIEGDLGWAQLSVLPSFQYYWTHWHNQFAEGQDVASYQSSLGTYLQTQAHQYAFEAHLSSPQSQALKWLVGVYYYDAPDWDGQNENLGTIASPVHGGQDFLDPNAGTYTDTLLKNRDYAAFAQTTIPLGDTTRATLGARFTRDEKSIHYVNNGRPSTPFLELWNTSTSTDKVTYKAGLEHDLTKSSLLYAQVATGFIGAAFNTTSFFISPPETLTAVEIGSKNRFLEDQLQINAEVFDNEIKNSQTFYSIPNPYLGQTIGGITITSPVAISGVVPASAREYGGEVETSWLFTPNDRVDASVAYLDAHYKQFTDTCVGTGTGCAAGASSPGYNGGVLPQAPKWTANLGYGHTFRLSGGSQFSLHGDAAWHSDYWLIFNYRDAFPPFFPKDSAYQGSQVTGNASANWASASQKWSWTANVRNVGNKATKTGWFGPNLQLADPRTYSVNLEVHF